MALGYRAALRWLILNDDCHWLEEERSALSVSASLVADIYEKPDGKVRRDLQIRWEIIKSPTGRKALEQGYF